MLKYNGSKINISLHRKILVVIVLTEPAITYVPEFLYLLESPVMGKLHNY